MHGKNRYGPVVFLLLFIPCIPDSAQDFQSWTDEAETTLNREDGQSLSETQCEEQEERHLHPVNLNTAGRHTLESCGLFTPFQVNTLIQYREKYGNLLCIYELASLPGFRKKVLEKNAAFMTVEEDYQPFPDRTGHGRLMISAAANSTDHESRSEYPGFPAKTILRFKNEFKSPWAMGLAYEKDAGERAFYGLHPEHFMAYLECKGLRIVEQLILGNFRLNIGMGLIQGAGLMHTPSSMLSRLPLLTTLKPYAGSGESINHQGVACRLNLGKVKCILWSSFQKTDLSLYNFDLKDNETDWSDYFRTTGYHRTRGDIKGRDLAYLGDAGIQVIAHMGNLSLGAQSAWEMNGLTLKGKDSLNYSPDPGLFHSASIHWIWRGSGLELYGELSPGLKNTSALLAGTRFFINDFLSGMIQFHYYEKGHRQTFVSAYSGGSTVANEKGMLFIMQAEPYRGLRTQLALELCKFPGPRTFVDVPSTGLQYMLTFENGTRETLYWRFQIKQTSRQKTTETLLPGIRSLTLIRQRRFEGRLVYRPLDRFSWLTRLVLTDTPDIVSNTGYAAVQQFRLVIHQTIRCTTQWVVFHVQSWDNRIYLHEPGLYQQFKFPVYSGSGHKISMLISAKPFKKLTVEVSGSWMRKRENVKWEAGMQLRLNI